MKHDKGSTIIKLYSSITRLITLLEAELDLLANNKNVSTLPMKKNIADMLSKLVNVTIALNKLSSEEIYHDQNILSNKDQEIIERFISKYKRTNSMESSS